MSTRRSSVTVLGAGSWGTTVASLAAANARHVLWARSPRRRGGDRHRAPQRALPRRTAPLPRALRATSDRSRRRCDGRRRARRRRAVARRCARCSPRRRRTCARGCRSSASPRASSRSTRLRPTQVIEEVLPGHPAGVLAGPNLAREVLGRLRRRGGDRDRPTSTSRAALQPLFRTRDRSASTRNADVLGCELGGVLKNVIAIAAGHGRRARRRRQHARAGDHARARRDHAPRRRDGRRSARPSRG